jgi:AcrR family transcriptional regulator
MPKIVDHEERRRSFARAAMLVALEQGVDGLTVRAVAKSARCSTGALTHYFKTKDDLLVAIQRIAGEASLGRINQCFAERDGRELLEAVILSVLPLDDERRAEWRLWLAYFARAAEDVGVAQLQNEHYRAWRSQLRRAYRRASVHKAPPNSEIENGTDAVMVLIQGLGVLGMYGPSKVGPRRQRRLVTEHLDKWLS